MTNDIDYAASARRVLVAIRRIDIESGESLQPFMEQFEHIKLRDGFVLDAFKCGNNHAAHYEFYARKEDASEPYEEPEHLKNRGLDGLFRNIFKKVPDSGFDDCNEDEFSLF